MELFVTLLKGWLPVKQCYKDLISNVTGSYIHFWMLKIYYSYKKFVANRIVLWLSINSVKKKEASDLKHVVEEC